MKIYLLLFFIFYLPPIIKKILNSLWLNFINFIVKMMSLSVLKHNLGTIIQLMLSFIKRNTKKEQYFSKFLHILSTLNRKTFVLRNDKYIMLILIEIMLDL